jgi:hypothetical protein
MIQSPSPLPHKRIPANDILQPRTTAPPWQWQFPGDTSRVVMGNPADISYRGRETVGIAQEKQADHGGAHRGSVPCLSRRGATTCPIACLQKVVCCACACAPWPNDRLSSPQSRDGPSDFRGEDIPCLHNRLNGRNGQLGVVRILAGRAALEWMEAGKELIFIGYRRGPKALKGCAEGVANGTAQEAAEETILQLLLRAVHKPPWDEPTAIILAASNIISFPRARRCSLENPQCR